MADAKGIKVDSTLKYWVTVVFALLMVGTVIFVEDRSFDTTERAAFDEFNRRQLVMANSASSAIQFYFLSISGALQSIAKIHKFEELDESKIRAEIGHTFAGLKRLGANDVGVLDANGIVKYTVVAPHLEGKDFSWRSYFQRAKSAVSDADYFTEFIDFKGVDLGQKGVVVAVPILRPGAKDSASKKTEFAGILVCTVKLNIVTERFVAPLNPSQNGYGFLADSKSSILWTRDVSMVGRSLVEKNKDSKSFQKIVGQMQAGKKGMSAYTDFSLGDKNGDDTISKGEWLIAYTPILVGDRSWTLGVVAPKEDARRQLASVYQSHLLGVGLSVLIIMSSAAFIFLQLLGTGRNLKQEVEKKTNDLVQAQEQVNLLQQKLLERVIVSQEKERQRISRELHDDLGQELAALLLQIKSDNTKPVPLDGDADNIHDQVRTLIDKVNRIAWDLRPIILDDYGLSSALSLHVEKTGQITGIQIDFKKVSQEESDPRLPPPVEVALFRITQEALKNAIEHGKPTQVSVILFLEPNEVVILIEDNGLGFEADAATSSYYDHGLGLLGMRERVALLNGTIAIESEVGKRTTVKVSIPRQQG